MLLLIAPAVEAAPARGAFFARSGYVHRQIAALDSGPIESVDGVLRFFWSAHGDEAETTRTAAHTVHHQVGFQDRSMAGERILQFVFGCVEREVSDK